MSDDCIPWRTSFLWGPAYIVAGHFAIDIPGRGHSGIYSQKERLCELVCDTVEGLRDDYNRRHKDTHKYDLPDILARKARSCRPVDRGGKNALQTRFLDREDWAPTCSLSERAYRKSIRLRKEDMLHAQEQEQKLQFSGLPGMYVCVHVRRPDMIRIGEGSKFIQRAQAHNGYGYVVARGYPTLDKRSAVALQDHILGVLNDDSDMWKRNGSRGHYIVPANGIIKIGALVMKYYRHFLHQTAIYNKELFTGL